MVRKGFILVEWMIQFLLCTLIGMIAFALFRTWSARLASLHSGLDIVLQLPNALDALQRDMQTVTSDTIEISSDRCSIAQQGQQILWQFNNDILFRSQKKYDIAQKKWRKAVKNVVAEKLAPCVFVPLYSAAATGVVTGLRVQSKNPVSEYVISLRNGREL